MKVRPAHVPMTIGYLLVLLGFVVLVSARPAVSIPLFVLAFAMFAVSAAVLAWDMSSPSTLTKWERRRVESERSGLSLARGLTEIDRQWEWRNHEQDARNLQRAQEWAARSRYMTEA